MRLCHKIAQQEPISSLLDHECDRLDLDHRLHFKSDGELEEMVRERLETVYHPTSSCRMAPLDQGGVVDSRLRVYGIDGLRICDASIFPSIVSGHPVRKNCYFWTANSNGLFCRPALVLLRPRNWRTRSKLSSRQVVDGNEYSRNASPSNFYWLVHCNYFFSFSCTFIIYL